MKQNTSNIILIIIFFIGLSIVLYPTVSNYWNQRTQSTAIVNYDESISKLTEADFEKYFQEAEEYNKKLSKLDFPLSQSDKVPGYDNLLNVTGNGMIGYLYIKKIKVELPVYHGTSDAVLDVATGHIKGSSLPIGGEGTHAAMSSHRGLPSAKLFTDLDKLEIGDTFTMTVLNRTITYEVDQIRIVNPDEVSDLEIVEGKDYCTLITCTPYGINSHRLLVRGHRIENIVDVSKLIISDAMLIEPAVVAPLIAMPILFILVVWLLIKYRKKK